MSKKAVDVSVRGLSDQQRSAIIEAVLQTPTGRVIIEGPESERKAANALIRGASNTLRVRFKSANDLHFHLDFARLEQFDSSPDRRLAFDQKSGLWVDAPASVPEFSVTIASRLDSPRDYTWAPIRFSLTYQSGSFDAITKWDLTSPDMGNYTCQSDDSAVLEYDPRTAPYKLKCTARSPDPYRPDILLGLPDFIRDDDVYLRWQPRRDGEWYRGTATNSRAVIPVLEE